MRYTLILPMVFLVALLPSGCQEGGEIVYAGAEGQGADVAPQAPPAPAAEPGEEAEAEKDAAADIPPPLTHYKGRRIAQTMHWIHADWLTRTEREREEGVAVLEQRLDAKIKPGMTVADLGCGNGFWTLRLAQMVGPEGRVYGVDIQEEMLGLLMERAEEAKVENIVPIHNNAISTKLPPESCDLILLVDVYHEFSHPEHMLRDMRQALKPNGMIALVEYRAEDPQVPIRPEHKMSKEQILKEYEPNGFKLLEEFDELPWQHVMYFTRDDAPAENRPQ